MRLRSVILAAGLIACVSSHAAEPRARDLADLTLEQLGNIEITSVSKRAEQLSDAAASVFVISADDIRRSGATSLPEALRLAPNLQVARADTNQYAITARGFNSVLANKMLVLVDGRIVYSPLFSGVFWEAQDVMLEDVERIEVISGPGGMLWGSNAVNGVINVITRPARDTQGALVTAGGGNRETGGAARYGGELASGGRYRVYGKVFERAHSSRANGIGIRDASDKAQIGFRADWDRTAQNFTLQGDAYHSGIDQAVGTRRVSGANLLGRWGRDLGAGSSLQLQAYYDHTERTQPGAINETLDTVDVEIQHRLRPRSNHNLFWGGGYRYAADRVENVNPAVLAFLPPSRNLRWANVFVQDEITLRAGLRLTAGLKLEHNNYTGLEFLPSVRLGWKMATRHLVWGAASRVVRAPSRVDRELFAPGNPPFFVLAGGPNFQSEVANVYEMGYRAQLSAALSYSITAFHHDFDRLRSIEPTAAGPMLDNKIDGTVDGVETWGSYRVTNAWRVNAGLVQQRERLRLKPGSADLGGLAALGNDARHWWTLRSAWDIGPRHEFDVMVRHVGALPNPAVPSYTAVDARLGWKPRRDLEISLAAQNLFDPRHPEWGAAAARAEFERGVFLKILWRQ